VIACALPAAIPCEAASLIATSPSSAIFASGHKFQLTSPTHRRSLLTKQLSGDFPLRAGGRSSRTERTRKIRAQDKE
jgi:hypothetical protein